MSQLRIPNSADQVLVDLMRRSPVLASEGTDNFELCSLLVEDGLMRRNHCPGALGAYQFTTTLQGEGLLKYEVCCE